MAIAILQGVGGKALQSKSLRIEKDGSYTVEADEGYALEAVAIEVDTPDKKPETELDLGVITENGAREITPGEGEVFNKVAFNVQVPPQGVEQFDERLDDIIALQESYIEDKPEPSEGLEYYFDGSTYYVSGRGSCTDRVIVIPDTYDDGVNGEHYVGGIYPQSYNGEDGAFYNDRMIDEIVLPERGISFYQDTFRGSSLKILRNYYSCASFGFSNVTMEYISILPSNTWIGPYELLTNGAPTYDFSRHEAVPVLNMEYSMPLTVGEGSKIIVPAALIDEWKSATNWTMFADYIVASGFVTTDERLEAIEGNVPEVHNAGYEIGFEDGKKAEYDAFWDAYQDNGNRVNYQYGFSGIGWNKRSFKPKHSVIPEMLNTAFWNFGSNDTINNAVDFVEVFDNNGLIFDTSNCTNFISAFMWASIKRLGTIDVRKDTSKLSSTFGYGKIKTIQKLIVDENLQFSNNTFQNQATLENITLEGAIGQNGLNLQWSTKLSKASIESVISCLSDTTSGLSVTFSKTARTNAFTDDEWAALIATKPNWTISLV